MTDESDIEMAVIEQSSRNLLAGVEDDVVEAQVGLDRRESTLAKRVRFAGSKHKIVEFQVTKPVPAHNVEQILGTAEKASLVDTMALATIMSNAELSVAKAPLRSNSIAADTRYAKWNPVQVREFLLQVGGWCGLHADKFLAAAVSGRDLDAMTDAMLEGVGVNNAWQRYKILDVIAIMKNEVSHVRQQNKLERSEMERLTSSKKNSAKKRGRDPLDYDHGNNKYAKTIVCHI